MTPRGGARPNSGRKKQATHLRHQSVGFTEQQHAYVKEFMQRNGLGSFGEAVRKIVEEHGQLVR